MIRPLYKVILRVNRKSPLQRNKPFSFKKQARCLLSFLYFHNIDRRVQQ